MFQVIWSTSRPCVFFILDTANRCVLFFQCLSSCGVHSMNIFLTHPTGKTIFPFFLVQYIFIAEQNSFLELMFHLKDPCLFKNKLLKVKDDHLNSTKFRIHLWDLGAGDIYPAHTVQFGDKVCWDFP